MTSVTDIMNLTTINNNVNYNCDMVLDLEYVTLTAALCATMCLFGLVYTFLGYRCFKAVMFLSGLIFGTTVVYVMGQEERILQHNLSIEAIAGIAVGIGVLCGFITMLVRYIGLFLQGFFLGLMIAIGAITALQKFYHPSTPWIPVGILFGTGILFSLLTLKWQKTFIILSTAVMGAALICTCLDYFMEKFLLLRYIWEALMAAPSVTVCWYTWVILGIWPTLAVLGLILQWKVTSKGYDHTDVIIRRGRKRMRTHLVRQQHHNHRIDQSDEVGVLPRPEPRPSRERSNNRSRSRERNQVANNQDWNFVIEAENSSASRGAQTGVKDFDTLPPSYTDCVEHGIGKPITERDRSRIIRTKEGSFLAPVGRTRNSETQSPAIREQILNQAQTGSGYVECVDIPEQIIVSTQPVQSARGSRQSRRGRSSGSGRQVQQTGQNPGSGRIKSSPSRGQSRQSPSRRGQRQSRASPAGRASSGSRNRRGALNSSRSSRGRISHSGSLDDRQSLLASDVSTQQQAVTRQPRASEAMVAHSRRLMAAQERQRRK